MSETSWEELLPKHRGRLPGGGALVRTDPCGPPEARIAVLGLYPAETQARIVTVQGRRIRLPGAVEDRSFHGSASAKELERRLLGPLRLTSNDVFLLDAYP